MDRQRATEPSWPRRATPLRLCASHPARYAQDARPGWPLMRSLKAIPSFIEMSRMEKFFSRVIWSRVLNCNHTPHRALSPACSDAAVDRPDAPGFPWLGISQDGVKEGRWHLFVASTLNMTSFVTREALERSSSELALCLGELKCSVTLHEAEMPAGALADLERILSQANTRCAELKQLTDGIGDGADEQWSPSAASQVSFARHPLSASSSLVRVNHGAVPRRGVP